jgi:hypothetical protein
LPKETGYRGGALSNEERANVWEKPAAEECELGKSKHVLAIYISHGISLIHVTLKFSLLLNNEDIYKLAKVGASNPTMMGGRPKAV